jgi:hypothetical protein
MPAPALADAKRKRDPDRPSGGWTFWIQQSWKTLVWLMPQAWRDSGVAWVGVGQPGTVGLHGNPQTVGRSTANACSRAASHAAHPTQARSQHRSPARVGNAEVDHHGIQQLAVEQVANHEVIWSARERGPQRRVRDRGQPASRVACGSSIEVNQCDLDAWAVSQVRGRS